MQTQKKVSRSSGKVCSAVKEEGEQKTSGIELEEGGGNKNQS